MEEIHPMQKSLWLLQVPRRTEITTLNPKQDLRVNEGAGGFFCRFSIWGGGGNLLKESMTRAQGVRIAFQGPPQARDRN